MNKSLEAYLVHLDMPLAFRLRAFYERYCSADDEAYLHLAAHAAFPIAMTPDLLYKIWLNFREDGQGNELKIPYVAVSDLLLSSLYRASGRNTFEMPDGIRLVLLDYLQEDSRFGEERKDELAYFLRAYLQENPQAIPSEAFRRAQEFIVKLRLERQVAAEELLKAYNQARHVGQVQHLLNMAEGELNGQEVTEDGQKNPLAVATEFVRGVQEYKRGNKEKGLELLERLKGRLSKGANGGIRVNLEQRILEALPEEVVEHQDVPFILGVFKHQIGGSVDQNALKKLGAFVNKLNEIDLLCLFNPSKEELQATLTAQAERIRFVHLSGYMEVEQLGFMDRDNNIHSLPSIFPSKHKIKAILSDSPSLGDHIEDYRSLGVPIIIAPDQSPQAWEAGDFLLYFYEELVGGKGIEEAFLIAINRITTSGLTNGIRVENGSDVLNAFKHWRLHTSQDARGVKYWSWKDLLSPNFNHNLLITADHHRQSNILVGRKKELEYLENLVFQEQQSPIAISGAEGIGKTTLAELFWEKHKHHFDVVAWLNYDQGIQETILSNIQLDRLGLNINFLNPSSDKYHNAQTIIEEIAILNGKKLIILDHVPEDTDLSALGEWFNMANLQLIITCVSSIGKNVFSYELPPLNKQEIVEFTQKFLQENAPKLLSEEIVRGIRYNHIIINLINKNIRHFNLWRAQLQLAELVNEIEQNLDPISQESSLIFALLKQTVTDPVELWLMLQIAALPKSQLTTEDFDDLVAEEGPLNNASSFSQFLKDFKLNSQETDLGKAIFRLINKGWVEQKEDLFYIEEMVKNTVNTHFRKGEEYLAVWVQRKLTANNPNLSYKNEEPQNHHANKLRIWIVDSIDYQREMVIASLISSNAMLSNNFRAKIFKEFFNITEFSSVKKAELELMRGSKEDIPDLILSENDFSTAIETDAKYAQVDSGLSFLEMVHKHFPKTHKILITSFMVNPYLERFIDLQQGESRMSLFAIGRDKISNESRLNQIIREIATQKLSLLKEEHQILLAKLCNITLFESILEQSEDVFIENRFYNLAFLLSPWTRLHFNSKNNTVFLVFLIEEFRKFVINAPFISIKFKSQYFKINNEILLANRINLYIQFLKSKPTPISQKKLAEELNVTSPTISNLISTNEKIMRTTFSYLEQEDGVKKFKRSDFIKKLEKQYRLSTDNKGNVVIKNLPIILSIFAQSPNQEYLSALEAEHDQLREILTERADKRHVSIYSGKAEQMLEILSVYSKDLEIFHYSGHASSESLSLTDQPRHNSNLAKLLKDCPNLQLVLLNGCQTLDQAQDYLKMGIPAVIATTLSITEGQAQQFAKYFYQALVKHQSIEDAFSQAVGLINFGSQSSYDSSVVIYRGQRLQNEDDKAPWCLYVQAESSEKIKSWSMSS